MERYRAVDVTDLPPSTVVNDWRVVRFRGRGSYGTVYHAEPVGQRGAGPFALKVARFPDDPRFAHEAQMLSRIRHPNVPRLRDQGVWTVHNGARFPYIVMEWVDGMPLYECTWHGPNTSREVMRLLAQVARALAAVHAVGGVHRDVKGLNILVTRGARAMLMDFGSAWYPGASVLTRESMPPGTPQYQSPEALLHQWRFRGQARRYPSGPADDVYALGVTAYKLVTSRYPEALDRKDWEQPPRLVSAKKLRPEAYATVSRELAVLIRRMLSENPEARGSAEEVAQALERAVEKAGRRADQRILPREPPRPLAMRLEWLRRWRPDLSWLGWLTASVVGTTVALSIRDWESQPRVRMAEPVQVARAAHERGEQDGETAALGDAALTARGGAAVPEPKRNGIGVDMPKKPFPGQRRPPCKKPEIEIHGGCWVGLRDAVPPCGDNTYEWNNGCYWPSFALRRPETSEPP